jgi:hypothetical protein
MSRARDLADGTFTGEVTVNDTVRLDTGDTTVSTDDVFGDIEFYDNDGGSAGAGVTAKIQATAASTYGASQLIFSTSSSSGGARTALTERIRILSSGGITFNGDTAAANALDDYEEGTWTPTCTTGTIGTAGGNYRKIGSMVWVNFYCSNFSDRTSSNTVQITNLPFTPSSSSGNGATGAVFIRYMTAVPFATYTTDAGISFYLGSSGDYTTVKHNNMTSSSSLFFAEATYFV